MADRTNYMEQIKKVRDSKTMVKSTDILIDLEKTLRSLDQDELLSIHNQVVKNMVDGKSFENKINRAKLLWVIKSKLQNPESATKSNIEVNTSDALIEYLQESSTIQSKSKKKKKKVRNSESVGTYNNPWTNPVSSDDTQWDEQSEPTKQYKNPWTNPWEVEDPISNSEETKKEWFKVRIDWEKIWTKIWGAVNSMRFKKKNKKSQKPEETTEEVTVIAKDETDTLVENDDSNLWEYVDFEEVAPEIENPQAQLELDLNTPDRELEREDIWNVTTILKDEDGKLAWMEWDLTNETNDSDDKNDSDEDNDSKQEPAKKVSDKETKEDAEEEKKSELPDWVTAYKDLDRWAVIPSLKNAKIWKTKIQKDQNRVIIGTDEDNDNNVLLDLHKRGKNKKWNSQWVMISVSEIEFKDIFLPENKEESMKTEKENMSVKKEIEDEQEVSEEIENKILSIISTFKSHKDFTSNYFSKLCEDIRIEMDKQWIDRDKYNSVMINLLGTEVKNQERLEDLKTLLANLQRKKTKKDTKFKYLWDTGNGVVWHYLSQKDFDKRYNELIKQYTYDESKSELKEVWDKIINEINKLREYNYKARWWNYSGPKK